MNTPNNFGARRRAAMPGRHQDGVTLIVALIMLIMLTMLALTSFSLGKSTLQVVNNMQLRDAGIGAARQVVEEAISNTNFYSNQANTLSNPCGAANTRCVDIDGDGTTDFTVKVATSCVKVKAIKNIDVDPNINAACLTSGCTSPGIEGSCTGDSQCVNAVWDLKATARDAVTQSEVVVVQGVATENNRDDIANICK
ncbi:MAG: hypothetical protein V4582_06825 [Pseudomonadota bacterium]